MNEYSKLLFYYDYIKRPYGGPAPVRVQGIISRSYRYPDIPGMLLHAYNGLRYFLRHVKMADFDPDQVRYFSAKEEHDPTFLHYQWPDLAAAFDVLFEQMEIKRGESPDMNPLHFDGLSEEQIIEVIADDSDADGIFYCSCTGNPEDGYTLRYGYDGGFEDLDFGIGDVEDAIGYFSQHWLKDPTEQMFPFYEVDDLSTFDDEIDPCAAEDLTDFFSNFELLSAEEISSLKACCIQYIRDAIKQMTA